MQRMTKRLSGPAIRARLRHEVSLFVSGYPTAWSTGENPAETPLERLLRALTAEISCDALLAGTARQLGADLRGKHDYITREDADEGSADLRRGLALLAIEALHGLDLSDLAGGDRLSPEQLAFYVADDFWPGRDDRPIEDWADIRRVREQLMLDALDMTGSERSDLLAFSAQFIERHPTLIHEAEWALRAVGSSEGFTDEVWAAAGADDLWRGVHFFAERILMSLPVDPQVH